MKGWFSRLKDGLTKSSTKITTGLTDILTKKKLDEDVLEDLEDLLIQADLGVDASLKLTKALSKSRFNKEVTDDEIKQALAEEAAIILDPVAKPLTIDPSQKPHVIVVVGVNGSGKTTTIGKLSHQWKEQGKSVRIVAGDTFRAAAVEQLKVWSERANVPIVVGAANADAAGLAYGAYEQSKNEKDDILIIDTAGRLQNKANLMAELSKIIRVLKKIDPTAPHSCLLVLDATTGQNAHSQVELFKQAVDVSGLIVTKLDGTAKGGVLISLAEKFKLPVHAIGVGESIEDLQPFNAKDYANSLMGVAEEGLV